ncbi:PadR family transcriptional regulator [Mycoplasmatota bacterium WC44]
MNSQYKKGVVELCVMKILSNRAMSTFEVLEIISNDLSVNENTVYPILRRLTNDNFLEVKKNNIGVGAPRKYYYLTESGFARLEDLETEWNNFIKGISKIMGGKYE